MHTSSVKLISFSVNNWIHLYSLEQAILRKQNASGGKLTIQGNIRNSELLANQDTTVEIHFNKVTGIPEYVSTDNQLVLGEITRREDEINCCLPVDETVFEELRKNLMEYTDIDGIHIVVTLGVLTDDSSWTVNSSLPLVKLDYAMKGDA